MQNYWMEFISALANAYVYATMVFILIILYFLRLSYYSKLTNCSFTNLFFLFKDFSVFGEDY